MPKFGLDWEQKRQGKRESRFKTLPFIALIQGEAEEKTRGGERGIGWTRADVRGGGILMGQRGSPSFLLNGKIVAEVSVERESRGVKGPLSAPQSRGGSAVGERVGV